MNSIFLVGPGEVHNMASSVHLSLHHENRIKSILDSSSLDLTRIMDEAISVLLLRLKADSTRVGRMIDYCPI